jgi:hypothetical protein
MPKMDDKISAGSLGPQPPSVRHCDGLGSGQARSLATGEGPTDIVTANLIAASKRALRACSASLFTDLLTENEAPSVNAARSDGMKDPGGLLSAPISTWSFALVVLLEDYLVS